MTCRIPDCGVKVAAGKPSPDFNWPMNRLAPALTHEKYRIHSNLHHGRKTSPRAAYQRLRPGYCQHTVNLTGLKSVLNKRTLILLTWWSRGGSPCSSNGARSSIHPLAPRMLAWMWVHTSILYSWFRLDWIARLAPCTLREGWLVANSFSFFLFPFFFFLFAYQG